MEGEIFHTHPDQPWGLPSLLYNGYRDFPGGKAAGAWCWPPTPISVPRSWKGRAIPVLTLWASVACYRQNIYLYPLTPSTVPNVQSGKKQILTLIFKYLCWSLFIYPQMLHRKWCYWLVWSNHSRWCKVIALLAIVNLWVLPLVTYIVGISQTRVSVFLDTFFMQGFKIHLGLLEKWKRVQLWHFLHEPFCRFTTGWTKNMYCAWLLLSGVKIALAHPWQLGNVLARKKSYTILSNCNVRSKIDLQVWEFVSNKSDAESCWALRS